jgi:hypothetical protein
MATRKVDTMPVAASAKQAKRVASSIQICIIADRDRVRLDGRVQSESYVCFCKTLNMPQGPDAPAVHGDGGTLLCSNIWTRLIDSISIEY